MKPKIRSKDITGLKYFDKLAPLLERLHDDGCKRDKAGNRDLHFDQYCMLILLYLFNPVVTSLRAVQQASELDKVQTYCAIIARLMISLWTGRKTTLRTFEMICFYFCGMASEAELTAHPQQT